MPSRIYFSNVLIGVLCLFAVISFFQFVGFYLYSDTYIEAVLLALLGLGALSFQPRFLAIQTALTGYVVVCGIYAVLFGETFYLDFALSYKAIFFLILLGMLVKKKFFSERLYLSLYWFLLFCFFLKYLGSVLILSFGRPFLFVENNFELLFLAILVMYKFLLVQRISLSEWIVIFMIAVLSGSRSGFFQLIVVFSACYFRWDLRIKTLGIYVLLSALGVAFAFVMLSRLDTGSAFEDIDRYRMLLLFFSETSSWNFWDYFFGSPRMTPLNPDACRAMFYNEDLLSLSGDGSCYSNIFHSFILRGIFDHGILILFLMHAILYQILRAAEISPFHSLVIVFLFVFNGLSVSGLNNVFGLLGVALITTVFKDEPSVDTPVIFAREGRGG